MNSVTLLLSILSYIVLLRPVLSNFSDNLTRHVYSPAQLRALRPAVSGSDTVPSDVALAHQCSHQMRRKRGRKGGVKARTRRRRHRNVLPVIITGNAQSVHGKLEELTGLCQYLHQYRDASVMCFTESWFTEKMPNDYLAIKDFHLERGDRDLQATGKTKGGGVCCYINEKYCDPSNIKVIDKISLLEIELLSLSIRPYYLPREFNRIIINIVYIPETSYGPKAVPILTDMLYKLYNEHPDAFIITTGDFNRSNLNSCLFSNQHIDRPTRGDARLDLLFTNIKCNYKCESLAPLGDSDHDMIRLLPNYVTKRQQTQPVEREICVLDDAGSDRLIDCFDCTDWQVFVDSCETVDELNEHVTEYVKFCESNCVVRKKVKTYGNTKPWVNKELKSLIIAKHKAHKAKDRTLVKSIQKDLKIEINNCKSIYEKKVENKFENLDSKGMWQGLKSMAGMQKKSININVEKGKEQEYVESLNTFYARFDNHDFSSEIENARLLLDDEDNYFEIEPHEVNKYFSKLKSNKASGPDGLSPKILKLCSHQLSYIYCTIFNMSLNACKIPTIWKTSKIIPVPKSN